MADITRIMGGPFRPKVAPEPDPPELQLADAMRSHGIDPPAKIVLDGQLHRFPTRGKKDDAGWYVAFGDGIPAGRFGCWRDGIEGEFRANVGRDLSPVEQMALTARMTEAKQARDAAREKRREAASDVVGSVWAAASGASQDHPYLKRKGVQPNGARVGGDGRLIAPIYDPSGTLTSLQYIDGEGKKQYHPGGRVGGCFWWLGTHDKPGPVYMAEGFATAATIHEHTGARVYVAYSAGNLPDCAGSIRQTLGDQQEIVIIADNDASGVGKNYAEQAAAKHGARVIVPPIPGDANDYVAAGHSMAELLQPDKSEWLIPADDFCQEPAPIGWLVKHWLQEQALIMVHGPSGGGKTFVVLDWCLRMASGNADWHGHKVKPGRVVYLAGEGHHGLRGRLAAWKHHHGGGSLNMFLSRSGCDLNTPQGYQDAAAAIRSLEGGVSLIVVDTLHRFLHGDENSAQDAKTMLDACAALMQEQQCSVLLVHHTGVNEEAQHRARGSSAWRGALDIEISVTPGKDDNPLKIMQRKSKDAEEVAPVFAELQSVEIPGWRDEDGEPVTSAVVVAADAPQERKKESKLAEHMKMFKRAWFAAGAEMADDGAPILARSALLNWLTFNLGESEATAKQMVKPSQTGRLIGALINGEIIENRSAVFAVINPDFAGAMSLEKGVGE